MSARRLEMSENQKARLCMQWLDYCLSVGWRKRDLDALADIFWKRKGWQTFKGYNRAAAAPEGA